MTRKRRRMVAILACLAGLGSATALALTALRSDITFFVTPSDLAARAAPGQQVRLGGLVEAGSVRKGEDGTVPLTRFKITDGKQDVAVAFRGVLPDLFREGQGVVTLGAMEPDGSFRASEVLAKHDATYMPRDVAEALKKKGLWRPEQGSPPPSATWDTVAAKPERGG
ncbi:MAG: cytochrome c maturation protein CcmE [Acetobacteraceae bacterium]|nr:cytochrome c maturation protein CcmE [Acetobacteraceae bacterium]